jgi:hypothetical protein
LEVLLSISFGVAGQAESMKIDLCTASTAEGNDGRNVPAGGALSALGGGLGRTRMGWDSVRQHIDIGSLIG